MSTFRTYDPDQSFLFPPSPRDWLPEDHLAWFVSETVDELDISALMRGYRKGGKGEKAYHPRMMLKVLIYAYCTGVFSSRKIARQIEENIAFRVLTAQETPSHRRICRFRNRNLKHFENLFVQVVQIAQEAKLLSLGTLVIDGSKIKANASKHKAMSYDRMQKDEQRLKKEIRDLTQRARQQDDVEDGEFGEDFRGDELPAEITRRKSRLKAIQAAKKRLEERKAEEARRRESERPPKEGQGRSAKDEPASHKPVLPKPKDQENFTDPDSRIMKTGSGGFEQGYNAQITVDSQNQMIVASGVTQSAADSRELIPMIERAEETTGTECREVLADSGYRSESNFQALEERGIRGYVALGREGKQARRSSGEATHRMKRRLSDGRGRKKYKTRKAVVEPVYGWIKQGGFRAFSLRGLSKVTAEWALVALSTNIRRMRLLVEWS